MCEKFCVILRDDIVTVVPDCTVEYCQQHYGLAWCVHFNSFADATQYVLQLVGETPPTNCKYCPILTARCHVNLAKMALQCDH